MAEKADAPKPTLQKRSPLVAARGRSAFTQLAPQKPLVEQHEDQHALAHRLHNLAEPHGALEDCDAALSAAAEEVCDALGVLGELLAVEGLLAVLCARAEGERGEGAVDAEVAQDVREVDRPHAVRVAQSAELGAGGARLDAAGAQGHFQARKPAVPPLELADVDDVGGVAGDKGLKGSEAPASRRAHPGHRKVPTAAGLVRARFSRRQLVSCFLSQVREPYLMGEVGEGWHAIIRGDVGETAIVTA